MAGRASLAGPSVSACAHVHVHILCTCICVHSTVCGGIKGFGGLSGGRLTSIHCTLYLYYEHYVCMCVRTVCVLSLVA